MGGRRERRKEWRRATKEIEERKEQTTENKKTHQTKAWKEENNGMMCQQWEGCDLCGYCFTVN